MLKRLRLAAALLAAILPAAVFAQQWPTHPVKILVGFAPGGGTDVVARLLAQKLQESFGQPFIVENRAGATGTIAADVVAKASPDGYTLLVTSDALSINDTLFTGLPFKSSDFVPVIQAIASPQVLVVHSKLPVISV